MRLSKICVFGVFFLLIMFLAFHVEAKPPKNVVDTKWEKKADKNLDGVVDAHELKAWQEHKAEVDSKWEKKADKNQDGVVDAHELKAWQELKENAEIEGEVE
jgi:hypothetical protein